LLYDDLNGPITSQVTPLPNSVAKCIWHVYEI
jgi:hypothetical protein